MPGVLIWLYLYGHEAVRRKLKNSLKMQKNALFACFWAYLGQPHDHIGWAKPMLVASINSTNQRTNPWNFREKILRIGGAGKWVFFSRPFWIFFSKKYIYVYIFSNENNLGFHIWYHFFLHYGCFLQNLGKDFIWTNMHTTVCFKHLHLVTGLRAQTLLSRVCGSKDVLTTDCTNLAIRLQSTTSLPKAHLHIWL